MKKLNIVFSFVLLSFCLFINVSSAIEINQKFYSSNVSNNNSNLAGYSQTALDTVGSYTLEDAQSILSDYLLNGNSSNFDSLINSIYSTYNEDKYVLYSYYRDSKGYYYGRLYTWNSQTTDIGKFGTTLGLVAGSDFHYIGFTYGSNNSLSFYKETYTNTSLDKVYQCINFHTYVDSLSFFGSNSDVKEMTYKSATNSYYYWDGTSYYYQAPSTEEPETPTMPTNAEIAQAVQLFNDNVYDEEKTGKTIGFNDFFVLYDKSTEKYSFIGHSMGTSLGQLIVDPDGYYEGYKYDVQWWKFFKDTSNNDYNIISDYTNYYVYTTDRNLETITAVGSSNISGLINKSGPWAASNTIIVYSTKDYPVKYITFSEDGTESNIQTGIIQGNQYTYDENLDIADNNYNPLDNFVTVDPIDTVIGNVNFSEINKTFEENKGILNIENASWLFTANNKLIGYFIGFLSLLIVFLIISRALGG